jgi:hypothetical membrane protein
MVRDNKKIAGLLLFVGGAQCILGIIIAETLYPGYSTSQNYISDLGIGPSALIFNSSVFLLGIIVVAGAYFIFQALKSKAFTILVAIAGIGAIGVGVFTENILPLHAAFTVITFAFSGISAIDSYKVGKPPFSYISAVLGVMTLIALPLLVTGNDLGLGIGGMERMIAYPSLIWIMGFGAYLMGNQSNK